MSINGAPVMAASVVAVDVGKNTAVLSVTDSARQRLLGPVGFVMTAPAVAAVVERVCAVLPGAAVKVGVEAAGHYHRPLLESRLWPAGWELLELSPARVSEQRRVQGRRRVKTDAIDLEAITDLVLAGHGVPVTARLATITELSGWAMHRSRRIWTRTATKNQLLAQLDRCFPGLTLALPDVLGTKVGRLVAAEFADPHRLGGAWGDSVCQVRREPRVAGAAVGGGAAGRGRPHRLAGPGGCSGPTGLSRRSWVAGRA